jgi:hypothetical protein
MAASDTLKPKLKTQQGKLPFWMRISDVLRLAKPFEMRVNMSQEQCTQAILRLGKFPTVPDAEPLRNFYKTQVNDNTFTVENPVPNLQISINTRLVGTLYEEVNMDITRIRGKVYFDFSLPTFSLFVTLLVFILPFPITDQRDAFFHNLLVIMLSISMIILLIIVVIDGFEYQRDFKNYLMQIEANPEILSKAEAKKSKPSRKQIANADVSSISI